MLFVQPMLKTCFYSFLLIVRHIAKPGWSYQNLIDDFTGEKDRTTERLLVSGYVQHVQPSGRRWHEQEICSGIKKQGIEETAKINNDLRTFLITATD